MAIIDCFEKIDMSLKNNNRFCI